MAHLVFQTAFPGDVFLSIPLLKRLRIWNPENSITLACRPGLGDFFLQKGLVDQVIALDKKSGAGREKLKAQNWDLIIAPHESVRTALWVRGLQAKTKIGFKKWWNYGIFDLRVTKPALYPDALRQLSLLTPIDSHLADLFAEEDFARLQSPATQESPLWFKKLNIPEWASMKVMERKPEARKIFLAPGSVWATKRWTEVGYGNLAEILSKRGYRVELVGSAAEKEICDRIAAKVPRVVNRAGQTSLAELVDLLSTGEALVCNDSGAMHAAAASGLPTVAIFGPTTLDLGFQPWNENAVVVQRTLKCRPCGKHGSQKCPIGTHECMEKIAPSEVVSALDQLLNRNPLELIGERP